MTQQSAIYPQPSFAQHIVPKRGATKKRERENFVPTEQQILAMCGCLTGVFKRHHGTIYSDANYRELAGELLSAGRIHCRGQRFGRSRREIEITVHAAFKRMKQDGKISREIDSCGRQVFVLAEWSSGRKRKDKYVNKASAR